MDDRKLAAVIASCIMIKRNRRKHKREVWVKEWVKKRSSFGCYNTLLQELRLGDERLYKNFTRMSAKDFDYLLEKVTPKIRKEDTVMRRAIPPGERLALTLRFLATGDSYHSLMYLFRIPVQTISVIVPECCQAIYDVLKDECLKVPSSQEEWKAIAEDFERMWNFPNCIGALDGKHVVIQKPEHSGSRYYNYKQTFSIVLMALVDANYKVTYADIGCNGRVSDGGVFQNCSLSSALEINSLNIPQPRPLPGRKKSVPFVITADDAFPLKPYLMKPYPYRSQPIPNQIYNYRLSRARRISENVFGLMANRFRILRTVILLEPEKVRIIISAILCLHNFLMSGDSRNVYAPFGSFDTDTAEGTTNGSWREDICPDNVLFSLQSSVGHNYSGKSKEIREEFKEYFVSPQGVVPWQYNRM